MRIETQLPITENMLRRVAEVISVNGGISPISAILTDSRLARQGDLFFPLSGKNFRGEDFVRDARKRGAYTVSASDPDATLLVTDPAEALLSLSGIYKRTVSPWMTVAITGSVGKTTTKDITASILSRFTPTHATSGNLNNGIGVPYTIFSMPRSTEVLIAEAGMNHKGELARIAEALDPDVAVITRIGTAHIGNLGSRADIAKAKTEILGSKHEVRAFIPYGEELLSHVGGITVGVDAPADNRLCISGEGCADFYSERLTVRNMCIGNVPLHIPECLAFALSVASLINPDPYTVRQAVEDMGPLWRERGVSSIGGIRIIDDSYNASLESIRLALKTLCRYDGRHIAVMGDVLELGAYDESIHNAIGELCAKSGLSLLFTFGEYADAIAEGAIGAGMDKGAVFPNPDINDPLLTANLLKEYLTAGDTVLFKASNGTDVGRIKRAFERL